MSLIIALRRMVRELSSVYRDFPGPYGRVWETIQTIQGIHAEDVLALAQGTSMLRNSPPLKSWTEAVLCESWGGVGVPGDLRMHRSSPHTAVWTGKYWHCSHNWVQTPFFLCGNANQKRQNLEETPEQELKIIPPPGIPSTDFSSPNQPLHHIFGFLYLHDDEATAAT